MNLRDQGFAFCISPDKKQGRWLHPAEHQQIHPDWVDVTDWPAAKLIDFLTGEPQQKDLFAA